MLRDGIPLNEHFLALKNKYNNEKSELEKKEKQQNDEIVREIHENEEKKQRIRIMKNEFDKLSEDFRREKDRLEREYKT